MNYALPIATDIVDGVVPVTCTPASGSMFLLGTTLVTCSATDTAGNTSSNSFTITVNSIDLIITTATTSTTTVKAGATLPLINTVQNIGSTASTSGFTIAYRLSLNTIYGDADDVVITTTWYVATLAAEVANTLTTSLAIPATTKAGDYYVCAKADATNTNIEIDEANNTRCSTSQVNVPLPDLIVSAISSVATTANAGATVALTNSIKNQGGSTAGSSVVSFRLSANAVYGDADDILSTTTRTIASLATGATSTANTSLLIPATIPAGTYYLCAKADNTSSVLESDEVNNAACTTTKITVPRPDLVMTALTTSATTVAKGASFLLANTAKNQGGSRAGAFAIRFVLSSNTVIGDADDIALTPQRSLAGLNVGISSAASTAVTVPLTARSGRFYIGAIADVSNAVAEGNEVNNKRVTVGTVLVP